MRNVSNTDEIDNLIQEVVANISGRAESEALTKWLKSTARKWYINEHPYTMLVVLDGGPIGFGSFFGKAPSVSQLKHYDYDSAPDWMRKAVEKDVKVHYVLLSSKDNQDLMTIVDYLRAEHTSGDMSRIAFPDALENAKKWHEQMLKKRQKELHQKRMAELGELAKKGTTMVKTLLSNGAVFYLYALHSKEALEYESEVMNHCVDSYHLDVSRGSSVILSLRDISFASIATIELKPVCTGVPKFENGNAYVSSSFRVVQVKGRYNDSVGGYISSMLRDFFHEYNIDHSKCFDLTL